MAGQPPTPAKNCPISLGPGYNFWADPSHPPKPHIYRFSCFCRAHERDRQTNRQTDTLTQWHTTYSVCSNGPHLAIAAMRPNNLINWDWPRLAVPVWYGIEPTSINCIRNSPVSMHINIFSVIEFVTFGMFYLFLCLRYRLQIILEDCLIKLIFLSLQCFCDSSDCLLL